MQKRIGKKCWAIPDGYLPVITEDQQAGPTGYISHECVCVLNAGDTPARLKLTFYFEDRQPVEIKDVVVGAMRSRHIRINELTLNGKAAIEQGCPYSLLVESDEPVVVQMSRLDTTEQKMAFLSTMAFAIE